MDFDENGEPQSRQETRGRKKGKKKSSAKEIYEPLPISALDGKGSEEIEELECANKILQSIMHMKNIQPFYEKPNDDSFGMSTYYNIIKEPIWLYEVKRKLNAGEYKGLADFILDMRLLFENCYRFWGPQHRITRKGLKLEHKFELRLQELPKHILDKLNREMPEGSIDLINTEVPDEPEIMNEIHIKEEINIKEEIYIKEEIIDDETNDVPDLDLDNDESNDVDFKEDSSNSWEPYLPESIVYYKPDRNASVFQSKILKKVMENDAEEDEEDEEEVSELYNKMMSWEREHLVNEKATQEIRSMWELAEIGSFLKLTHEVLNVEEITQYEVERMLLMPKESTTLMTLMTSMLSSEIKRPSLDESPLMPYEIWTAKMKRKIDEWMNLSYDINDPVLLFEKLGIEPFFWNICKNMNPLNEKRFHELSFYERAVILKALCNYIFHTNKTIIDIFNKEQMQMETLRPKFLGKDTDGNAYLSLWFLPEVRVYKETKFITKNLENWDQQETLVWKVQKYFSQFHYDEETKDVSFGPTDKFCLVADDLDSLTALIDQMKIDEQFVIVSKLTVLETEARAYKVKHDGLKSLYQQWHRYQDRAPEYFTNMLNLWLRTEKPAVPEVKLEPVEKVSDPKDFEEENNQAVLGKRRSAKLCFTNFASDCDFGSDTEDDWEPSRKKKRKKSEKKKKESSVQNNDHNSEIKKTEVKKTEVKNTENEPIDNKTSLIICPANNTGYKPFPTQKTVNETNNAPSLPIIRVVPLDKIKEEVISISSDEDDNVTSTTFIPAKPITSEVTVHPVTTLNHSKFQLPNQSVIIQKITNPMLPRNNRELTIQPVRQSFNQSPVRSQAIIMPHPMQQPQTPPRQQFVRTPQMRSPVQQQMLRSPQQIRSPAQQQMMRSPGQNQMIRSPGQNQMIRSPGQNQMIRSPGQQQIMRSPVQQQMMRSPGQQQMLRSPRQQFSPRGIQISPVNRQRTPITASPRRGMPQRQMNPKALFSSPPCLRPVPAPLSSPPDTIGGTLSIGTDTDGTLRYRVKLPDGGIINLSTKEVDDLRRKNNGVLPANVNVPLIKRRTY